MSILMSPSDNTGWGSIGTALMRATGVKFSKRQPVRVRPYYRAQWGQLNARTPLAKLRENLKKYERKHRKRQKKTQTVFVEDSPPPRRRRRENKTRRIEKYLDAIAKIRAFNRARRRAAI
ncbi:pVII [Bovine atadenovirus D]|uniref:PVII n=1 Tax=Bovine adenovirus 4 TaxID=70333 RepID=Q997H9_ADEB4|nr:pVII [Bovine atadenovirus D]AAK13178.1 pVII [Bovine adenovirus 4]